MRFDMRYLIGDLGLVIENRKGEIDLRRVVNPPWGPEMLLATMNVAIMIESSSTEASAD